MERPLAVIGFTYLSALLVALFFGVQSSLYIAIAFFVLFVISVIVKPLRKSPVILVIFITVAISVFSFYVYSSVYVLPAENIQGKTANVTAILCDIPYEQNGRYYYKLETNKIDVPNSIQNTTILVSSKNAYNIEPYDSISVKVKFFDNGTGINNNYYISKKIILKGMIDDYSEVTVSENDNKPLYYYALKLKQNITETIQSILPKKESSFITALLLGDKTGISYNEKEIFASAGISHIISVSGFHLAVVTQMFMFILCFISRRERLSSVICTFIIFAFMAVTGFSPSVFRAGIMQIIYLVGKSILRQSDSLNSLGFAAFVICFLNPYSAADVGFLLSFSATLGIILCSKKMTVYISEHIYKPKDTVQRFKKAIKSILLPILNSVISIISITLSATIFTLPITILFFKQFALYSLIANLMISFAASVLIFTAIIMILFKISVVFSFMALPFAVISGILTNYIIWAAQTIASMPFSTVTVSSEFIPLWLGLMLLLTAFIFILKNRKRVWRYFVFVAVFTFLIGSVSDNIFKSGSTKISILDVGQGLSVVISKDNDTAVLSCGGEWSYTSILNNYLESSSVDNIYYLLLMSSKDENSAFAERLLTEFSADNIQVYNENNYYERMHRLISQSQNVILSESNSESTVYFNDIAIKTINNNKNTAIFFKSNNISFLICSKDMDCSILPEEWRNSDFLIVDGILENDNLICPKYIIISDNYENLSYNISQFSMLSEHIYATGGSGNIALWLYDDNTISIRREKEWLS